MDKRNSRGGDASKEGGGVIAKEARRAMAHEDSAQRVLGSADAPAMNMEKLWTGWARVT